jgi:hypothetical protein
MIKSLQMVNGKEYITSKNPLESINFSEYDGLLIIIQALPTGEPPAIGGTGNSSVSKGLAKRMGFSEHELIQTGEVMRRIYERIHNNALVQDETFPLTFEAWQKMNKQKGQYDFDYAVDTETDIWITESIAKYGVAIIDSKLAATRYHNPEYVKGKNLPNYLMVVIGVTADNEIATIRLQARDAKKMSHLRTLTYEQLLEVAQASRQERYLRDKNNYENAYQEYGIIYEKAALEALCDIIVDNSLPIKIEDPTKPFEEQPEFLAFVEEIYKTILLYLGLSLEVPILAQVTPQIFAHDEKSANEASGTGSIKNDPSELEQYPPSSKTITGLMNSLNLGNEVL